MGCLPALPFVALFFFVPGSSFTVELGASKIPQRAIVNISSLPAECKRDFVVDLLASSSGCRKKRCSTAVLKCVVPCPQSARLVEKRNSQPFRRGMSGPKKRKPRRKQNSGRTRKCRMRPAKTLTESVVASCHGHGLPPCQCSTVCSENDCNCSFLCDCRESLAQFALENHWNGVVKTVRTVYPQLKGVSVQLDTVLFSCIPFSERCDSFGSLLPEVLGCNGNDNLSFFACICTCPSPEETCSTNVTNPLPNTGENLEIEMSTKHFLLELAAGRFSTSDLIIPPNEVRPEEDAQILYRDMIMEYASKQKRCV